MDAFTIVLEELFNVGEIDYFYGDITCISNPKPEDMHSETIHNPTLRYFHKILAHTLFGKAENITTVSRVEIFIMFCTLKNLPINGATFILANFHRLARAVQEPILIGGLVTMIVNATGLRQQLLDLVPQGRFQPMDINFSFNRGIIGNLCRGSFDLLINNHSMPLFTLLDSRTSICDRNNWLYD